MPIKTIACFASSLACRVMTVSHTNLAKPGSVCLIGAPRYNWCHIRTSVDQYTSQHFHSLPKPHLISQHATWRRFHRNWLASNYAENNHSAWQYINWSAMFTGYIWEVQKLQSDQQNCQDKSTMTLLSVKLQFLWWDINVYIIITVIIIITNLHVNLQNVSGIKHYDQQQLQFDACIRWLGKMAVVMAVYHKHRHLSCCRPGPGTHILLCRVWSKQSDFYLSPILKTTV